MARKKNKQAQKDKKAARDEAKQAQKDKKDKKA